MKYYVSDSFLTSLRRNKLNSNKNNQYVRFLTLNSHKKNYHFSQRYTEELLKRIQSNSGFSNNTISDRAHRENIEAQERELHNSKYYETLLKKLNSKNASLQNLGILGEDFENLYNDIEKNFNKTIESPRVRIIINKNVGHNFLSGLGIQFNPIDEHISEMNEMANNPDGNSENRQNNDDDDDDNNNSNKRQMSMSGGSYTKTKNFEVMKKPNMNFLDVGGYENVKDELRQCVDILKNYQKYKQYNVRIPKGLILEGPPGTGKTLIAKALAGEAKCSFVPVSGSDFQEKYVGVGPTRIKELFRLARENIPCIIFVDEIDALGRKRSTDGESSSNERDNTLNALLVELDGFKNTTGVFLVAATNRFDLLDNALTRPGRIDKKIYIGLPDKATRESIINIHIKGKPYDSKSVDISNLVEITDGLSGAQIENLLNEAMLNALRCNQTQFNFADFDFIMNKMMAGWQPNEHEFTSDIIDHIAIHEMGHAVVGFLSKHHSKMSKVVINLSSPKSPGYTVFESSTSNIYVREALFEHLMILLSGRIAEEVFYNVSVTTGALNDFEEALKLAEKMVLYYGMGSNIIYPSNSEKYKELIDNDVIELINNAYKCAHMMIMTCKDLIYETSEILKNDKLLKADALNTIINEKYKDLLDLKMEFE
uniref:AAA+ ATPase domain-containing protein n=1 Tax=viral metagenome TaxID=1070528 RepID=A0A6C0JHN2_9ZZZZ